MQTVIITILIATVLLLLLPIRVRFFLIIESDLIASIKIEFVFTVQKRINLLASKSKKATSGLFTMKTAKLALDVFYFEEINSMLSLSGSDIKRDIDLIATYQIVTNSLLSYIKMRYNGKYVSKAVINFDESTSFSLESVIWFNLLTLGVLGVSVLVNLIKSKVKAYKRIKKEKL